MQCHLGLCLAVRCDLTLEPFTRGLASEDADKQTQRLVAVIGRRLLTTCATRPSIALLSRPDHSAVASCREVDLSALAAHVAVFFSGHHVIANRSGGPQARSSPLARQGRNEAEWLDRAEDRRTIRRRDGPHRLGHQLAQRENLWDERNAQVGKQSGGDGSVPSQAEIQRECAFTYMNAVSRKNLTDARAQLMLTTCAPRTTQAPRSAVSPASRRLAGRS